GILDLREIRPPLDWIALRPHDRLLARETPAFVLGLLHELGDELPGAAGFRGVHAVDAEHGRWVQHVARAVAHLVRSARPGREIAVARAVDEQLAADREAPRLRLDDDRVDTLVRGH